MMATAKPPEDNAEFYWAIVGSIITDKNASTHPHLRRVSPDNGFKLKVNDSEVLAECFLLEELKDALIDAPEDALLHHLDNRNDFATWVKEIIGDKELGADLERMRPSSEADVKAEIVRVLDLRIKTLKSDSVNLLFD